MSRRSRRDSGSSRSFFWSLRCRSKEAFRRLSVFNSLRFPNMTAHAITLNMARPLVITWPTMSQCSKTSITLAAARTGAKVTDMAQTLEDFGVSSIGFQSLLAKGRRNPQPLPIHGPQVKTHGQTHLVRGIRGQRQDVPDRPPRGAPPEDEARRGHGARAGRHRDRGA